ncbi:MlaD family protein [Nocardia sp. NPDC051756]|uniref:MlaD family protein n=1 Tax=Nocardia sp. NPDC051756 TaxID=3154751 RepID=UPI00341E03D3
MTRPLRVAALLALAVALVTGCAVRPMDMPLPGTRYGKPTYQVRVEFSNVLTLPLRTHVELNGAKVGLVESVSVRPAPNAHVPSLPADKQPYYQAGAVLVIDKQVVLPVETKVEMAQGTLFGDTFVKLSIPPQTSGKTLAQGDTIPITQTKQAVNVEDYMTAVVGWVTGGNVPYVQNFVSSINQAFPAEPGDFKEFMAKTAVALERIGQSTAQLSAMLNNATAVLDTLGHADDVWRLIFDGAPVLLGVVGRVLPQVLYFVDAIRDLAGYANDSLVDPNNPTTGARTAAVHRFLDVWTPLAQAIIAAPNQLPRTLGAVDALLENKVIPFLSARGRPYLTISDVVPQTPPDALTGDPVADARIVAANEQAFRDRVTPVLRLVGLVR